MSLGRPWTRVYEFEMRLANIEKGFWDEFGVRLVDLEWVLEKIKKIFFENVID